MEVLALFVIAASPRLYFYDALLLAVPAIAWYADVGHAERSERTGAWRVVRGAAVIAWLGTIGIFWSPLYLLVGPAAVVWLAAESRDLTRAGARVRAIREL